MVARWPEVAAAETVFGLARYHSRRRGRRGSSAPASHRNDIYKEQGLSKTFIVRGAMIGWVDFAVQVTADDEDEAVDRAVEELSDRSLAELLVDDKWEAVWTRDDLQIDEVAEVG